MNLLALPVFADNLIWMLHDGRQAVVVDPGDATPVLQALRRQELQLSAILVTHHHRDHVRGIEQLLPRLRGPLYLPPASMPGSAHFIPAEAIDLPEGTPALAAADGMCFELLGLRVRVLETPGHTAGHVAYLAEPAGPAEPAGTDARDGWLFCGDALFSAGCGRLSGGTAAQMQASLARLADLPAATRVCCGHEYTLDNLEFAARVEPEHAPIALHRMRCRELRARGAATLPSRIAQELAINPFLRLDQPAVIDAARAHGAASAAPVDVFTALREWKTLSR